MTDKKTSTNMAFTQQQKTQISDSCKRVQNAININNSTLVELNEDLVRKADEIAIKWRAYGLPYNAICDAVLEMAMWQKEQLMKNAIDADIDVLENISHCVMADISEEQYYKLFGQKIKIIIVEEDEQ